MSEKAILSLSASAKLLVFTVPLLLVSILVLVAGPTSSGRVLLSDYSWKRWNLGSSSKHDDHRPAAASGVTAAAAADVGPRVAVFEVQKQIEEEPARSVIPETQGDSALNVSASPSVAMEVALGHESDRTVSKISDLF